MTMKKIKSTVSYIVPHWNFCNSDNLINGGELSKETCKFCVKTKTGHRCLLYGVTLDTNDGFISKLKDCCMATAGFASAINIPPPPPTVPPKEIMKQAIDIYNKTMNDLMSQGYPRQMAENIAKKYVLGDN